MASWETAILALIGAVIGASASVIAQVVNQSAIRRREDRDKLRMACIDFGEAAFRFVQRAEITVIYTQKVIAPYQGGSIPPQVQDQQWKMMMEAGAAQDQLTTALCKVTILAHGRAMLVEANRLYEMLMVEPSLNVLGNQTVDDTMKLASSHRALIQHWLHQQSLELVE